MRCIVWYKRRSEVEYSPYGSVLHKGGDGGEGGAGTVQDRMLVALFRQREV